MTEEINSILALLECTLKDVENPDYIEVTYQLNTIYILLAKKEYKDIPLHERVMRIKAYLDFEHEDILDKYPVLIETYDEDQLKELLEMYKRD